MNIIAAITIFFMLIVSAIMSVMGLSLLAFHQFRDGAPVLAAALICAWISGKTVAERIKQ